jgi:exopolyphosphatase/pppGpp-phosphohydrolase
MIRIPLLILLLFALGGSHTFAAENHQDLRDTGLVCAVDMGSNTFKLIIAEIKQGKYFEYLDERKTAGVGDDLKASEKKSGRKLISDSKLQEIGELLAGFQDLCEQKTRLRKIYAIATAAFREAENGKALSDQLRQKGVELQILTAEQESAYAYEAATLGRPGLAVVDLGSRTTEFVAKPGAAGERYQWSEIHTGYKVAWDDFYDKAETFAQASGQHLKKLNELIGEKETRILRSHSELVLIEVGEMASFILGVPQNQIEERVITRAQVQEQIKKLSAMDASAFADLKKNFENAAKVLPRLVLTDFVLANAGYDQFRGTNRELNIAIIYRIARRPSP